MEKLKEIPDIAAIDLIKLGEYKREMARLERSLWWRQIHRAQDGEIVRKSRSRLRGRTKTLRKMGYAAVVESESATKLKKMKKLYKAVA
jgi:hypothetical protein